MAEQAPRRNTHVEILGGAPLEAPSGADFPEEGRLAQEVSPPLSSDEAHALLNGGSVPLRAPRRNTQVEVLGGILPVEAEAEVYMEMQAEAEVDKEKEAEADKMAEMSEEQQRKPKFLSKIVFNPNFRDSTVDTWFGNQGRNSPSLPPVDSMDSGIPGALLDSQLPEENGKGDSAAYLGSGDSGGRHERDVLVEKTAGGEDHVRVLDHSDFSVWSKRRESLGGVMKKVMTTMNMKLDHTNEKFGKLTKMFGLLLLVVLAFTAATFTINIVAIETTKETRTGEDGSLRVAGSEEVVKTRSSEYEVNERGIFRTPGGKTVGTKQAPLEKAPLTSLLPDSAFSELKTFAIYSPTGAYVEIDIHGFARIPRKDVVGGSVVYLVTVSGHIILSGRQLTFDDLMGHLFEMAGFDMHQSGRSLLGIYELIGLFNAVEEWEGLDEDELPPGITGDARMTYTMRYPCSNHANNCLVGVPRDDGVPQQQLENVVDGYAEIHYVVQYDKDLGTDGNGATLEYVFNPEFGDWAIVAFKSYDSRWRRQVHQRIPNFFAYCTDNVTDHSSEVAWEDLTPEQQDTLNMTYSGAFDIVRAEKTAETLETISQGEDDAGNEIFAQVIVRRFEIELNLDELSYATLIDDMDATGYTGTMIMTYYDNKETQAPMLVEFENGIQMEFDFFEYTPIDLTPHLELPDTCDNSDEEDKPGSHGMGSAAIPKVRLLPYAVDYAGRAVDQDASEATSMVFDTITADQLGTLREDSNENTDDADPDGDPDEDEYEPEEDDDTDEGRRHLNMLGYRRGESEFQETNIRHRLARTFADGVKRSGEGIVQFLGGDAGKVQPGWTKSTFNWTEGGGLSTDDGRYLPGLSLTACTYYMVGYTDVFVWWYWFSGKYHERAGHYRALEGSARYWKSKMQAVCEREVRAAAAVEALRRAKAQEEMLEAAGISADSAVMQLMDAMHANCAADGSTDGTCNGYAPPYLSQTEEWGFALGPIEMEVSFWKAGCFIASGYFSIASCGLFTCEGECTGSSPLLCGSTEFDFECQLTISFDPLAIAGGVIKKIADRIGLEALVWINLAYDFPSTVTLTAGGMLNYMPIDTFFASFGIYAEFQAQGILELKAPKYVQVTLWIMGNLCFVTCWEAAVTVLDITIPFGSQAEAEAEGSTEVAAFHDTTADETVQELAAKLITSPPPGASDHELAAQQPTKNLYSWCCQNHRGWSVGHINRKNSVVFSSTAIVGHDAFYCRWPRQLSWNTYSKRRWYRDDWKKSSGFGSNEKTQCTAFSVDKGGNTCKDENWNTYGHVMTPEGYCCGTHRVAFVDFRNRRANAPRWFRCMSHARVTRSVYISRWYEDWSTPIDKPSCGQGKGAKWPSLPNGNQRYQAPKMYVRHSTPYLCSQDTCGTWGAKWRGGVGRFRNFGNTGIDGNPISRSRAELDCGYADEQDCVNVDFYGGALALRTLGSTREKGQLCTDRDIDLYGKAIWDCDMYETKHTVLSSPAPYDACGSDHTRPVANRAFDGNCRLGTKGTVCCDGYDPYAPNFGYESRAGKSWGC